MTSLLSTLRNDALAARKSRDAVAASLLVTLLSESADAGLNDGKRESTDAEVLATVRKFLKGNGEALAVRGDDEVLKREKALLEGYLPQQMDESQLRAAIEQAAVELGLVSTNVSITAKDTGALMKALNARYAGQFAGAQASALIKQMAT